MTNETSPGLYVHIPFCMGKCPYCDFYSEAPLGRVEALVRALPGEAEIYRRAFPPFGSIYFGGGTPSLLDIDDFAAMTLGLREELRFAGDPEVTVEVNPDDMSGELAAAYRSLSVNRISIGVQSFDDDELKFLGRRHDSSSALRAFEVSRKSGIENISVDLMYGFARQRRSSWERTLRMAADLGPEHISCYQFTVHDDTPMGRLRATGGEIELPEADQREIFLMTSRYLTGRGYIHYEVSNFARDEKHISSHNSRYWRHAAYLGLGPSAHSFLNGERWWNVSSVDAYLGGIGSGEAPVSGRERLDGAQISLERLFLGFRTLAGVPLSLIDGYHGGSAILENLRDQGLVEVSGERAVPTVEGYLVADSIPLLFISGGPSSSSRNMSR